MKKSTSRIYGWWFPATLLLLICATECFAQTTSFTYQGRLTEAGAPAGGTWEMQFKLFDAAAGGTQQPPSAPVTLTFAGSQAVTVANGVFNVQLDFGANAFPGADRYLEISVKRPGETSFTPLRPRQQLAPTPYAVRAWSAKAADTAATADTAAVADTANNAKQLGGVAANQYVQTGDSRLTDARWPKPGSADYIQNTNSPQLFSNFNISGDGTVGGKLSGNLVNAATQYNIGNNRVLTAGIENLFAGFDAGTSNGVGRHNSFFGASAGNSNNAGNENSFFGRNAGQGNTEGSDNSFFGVSAGLNNSAGGLNSFVGAYAGQNSTGNENSFFGASAGQGNMTGTANTLVGTRADVGSSGLDHATAIGADALVRNSNTIALGRPDGSDKVVIYGFGEAGSTHLCRNTFNQITECSSSLRYKTNIAPFSSGLNLIRQLRPISFDWKIGGMHDVGFGAEEVAAVDPLFVNYNSKGQVEGVKYDRLSVAFVNAFKEQQAQIEQQREQLKLQRDQLNQQQSQIEVLKKFVCLDHPNAEWCK